jgi:hypothetical protein
VGIFLAIRVTEISENWFFVLVNPITGNGAGGNCGIQEGLLEPACLDVVAIRIPSGIKCVYIATHLYNAYYEVNMKINIDPIIAHRIL